MRSTLSRAIACTLVLAAPAAAGAQQGNGSPPPPTPPAVSLYTEEQATRGEAVHKRVCAECHETLDYRTDEFKTKWNGRPAFNLFDLLLTTMPDENPGTLPRKDYADAMAYMFRLNGVPPGKTELPTDADALKALKMEIPPRK